MAIQLTPISSKYFSEIKNGPSFNLNTGDFGTHLKGTPGERMKAEITVQISWRFDITTYDITNTNTITLQSGSFFSEGFSIGDDANLTFRGAPVANHTFTITSISSDGKQMVTSGAVLPNGGFGASTYDTLRGLTPLEGLKYKFNFIGNDDTTTFISILDETTMAYKTDGIRTAFPTAVVSTWDDTIIGSQTGNHQVSFIQDVSDGGIIAESGSVVVPLDSIQEFKIEHEFIVPYYLDGELINLQTLIRPERIEAGISLKPVMEFEFRSTLSNPNTAKTGRLDNVLGQTSYFNQNFGDEATQYSITNVVLSSGAGIDSDNITNLQFSVLSANASFVTLAPVVAYHTKLPVTDEYVDKTTNFETNFIYESLRATIDGTPTNGTIFTDLDVDLISTSQIDVDVNIQFTAAQKLLIDEGKDYFVSVGVADDSLTTDLSDKAILKVNLSEYIKDNDVTGLMSVSKLEVYTHPMDFDEGVTIGYTGFKGWVQDGIMWDWAFSIDRTLDAVLERFRIRLVALKTADNTFFELEDVEYDLSGQVVTPGTPTTQQIEISETRGFPLGEDSIFNLKTFTTGTYSAPNQPYTGQTSFLVNWQEWLNLPGADAIFYNVSEPNDGLNQKASQYSLKEGYEIRFLLDADVSVDGASTTNYIFKSPDAVCLDFEEQDGTPITWTSIKETFDLDGANLNQEILTNEDTEVLFTYVPDAVPGLASLYWGHYTIEEVNQPGIAIDRMSTLNYIPLTGQGILIPLDGETRVKQTLVSGNIEHRVLIDNNKLNPAKSYNVYGRFGLLDQAPVAVPTITSEVDMTLTEGAQTWISTQQTEIMSSIALEPDLFGVPLADLNFRTSSVEPGADQTDRSNWNLGGVVDHGNGAVGLAAMIVILSAESTFYYFIEATTTGYVEAGVVLTYDKLGAAVQPQTVLVNFPANSINNDFVLWFDKRAHITNLTPSQLSALTLELRTSDAASEDWTDCTNTSTATFNTAVDGLAIGTKMACQFHGFKTSNIVGSLQFDVEYIDDVDNEKEAVITPNSFNGEWRPFDNPNGCIEFDQTNDAVNLGPNTMTQFMDIDNEVSIEYWFEAGVNSFEAILSCTGDPGMGSQRGLAVSLIAGDIRYQLREDGSTLLRRQWDVTSEFSGGIVTGMKYCLIITKTTSNLASGLTAYLQGRKLTDIILDLSQITAGTTVTPDGTIMCHSSFQDSVAPLFVAANTNKSAILRIYNRVLTDEEIRKCYLDIEAGASYTGLIRDYDFAGVTTSTLTDLTGNEDGTLINHLNTATTFY